MKKSTNVGVDDINDKMLSIILKCVWYSEIATVRNARWIAKQVKLEIAKDVFSDPLVSKVVIERDLISNASARINRGRDISYNRSSPKVRCLIKTQRV